MTTAILLTLAAQEHGLQTTFLPNSTSCSEPFSCTANQTSIAGVFLRIGCIPGP